MGVSAEPGLEAGVKGLTWLGVAVGALGLAAQAGAAEPNKADPLYQSKGDQKRTYKFAPTGEILPYRTYVPTTWAPGKKLPLVLVLHGGGLDENAPFQRTPAPMKDELQKLAEEFGFIVVSPIGYSMAGGFGAPPPAGLGGPGGPGGPGRPPGAGGPPPGAGGGARPPMATGPAMMATGDKAREYSEQDVLNTVEIVEKEYGADTAKVFITGNSMGAIGTMYLAAKYPDKWLAMAPSEGGFDPARYGDKKYGVKGALLIHKQDDKAPQVETQSTEFVKLLSGEGIDAFTLAVPNAVHENTWFLALPITFHFFDKFAQGK